VARPIPVVPPVMRKVLFVIICSKFRRLRNRTLPKSTLSQHFKILREAGLIWSERKGVEMHNTTRYAELKERFGDVLAAILATYGAQVANNLASEPEANRSGANKRAAQTPGRVRRFTPGDACHERLGSAACRPRHLCHERLGSAAKQTTTAGSNPNLLGTLPAAASPKRVVYGIVHTFNGTYADIAINPNGQIGLIDPRPPAVKDYSFVSLECITYQQ
jgi:hypothetical protein